MTIDKYYNPNQWCRKVKKLVGVAVVIGWDNMPSPGWNRVNWSAKYCEGASGQSGHPGPLIPASLQMRAPQPTCKKCDSRPIPRTYHAYETWFVDTGHFFHTSPIQCRIFWAYFNVNNPKFVPFLRASEVLEGLWSRKEKITVTP